MEDHQEPGRPVDLGCDVCSDGARLRALDDFRHPKGRMADNRHEFRLLRSVGVYPGDEAAAHPQA